VSVAHQKKLVVVTCTPVVSSNFAVTPQDCITLFAVLIFGSAISAASLQPELEVVARFACFARRRSAAPVIQESSTP
jgi:hypothetical protein